jgi:hypothetical protein
VGDEVRSSTADTVARGAAWEGEAVLAAVTIMKGAMVASIMEAVAARAARAPVEPATTLFDWWREECCWALVPGTLVRCLPGRRALSDRKQRLLQNLSDRLPC